jgi:hypothetical protein
VDVKDEAEDWAIGPDDEGKKPCSRGTKMLMTQVSEASSIYALMKIGALRLSQSSKLDRRILVWTDL